MSPRHPPPRNPHSLLTPTTSSSSMIPTQENDASPAPHSLLKPSLFSWKVLGGIFATILVVGWVFIIVILIQEEKWQMVLVAWLLLYAAAHFCYWYFKRHHLLSLHSQICGRSCRTAVSVLPVEKGPDAPPSYDDIIKSEAPPPTYYSVVDDAPKAQQSPASSPSRLPFFLQGLPKVFGRGSPTSSPPSTSYSSSSPSSSSYPSSSSSTYPSSSSSCSSTTKSTAAEEGKSSYLPSPPPPPLPPSSISGSLAEQSYSLKSYGRSNPPPSYTDSLVDSESQVITTPYTLSSPPSPSRMSIIRSISRTESVINEELHPIFSPIYKNSPAPSRPHTSQEAVSRASTAINSERKKKISTSSIQSSYGKLN